MPNRIRKTDFADSDHFEGDEKQDPLTASTGEQQMDTQDSFMTRAVQIGEQDYASPPDGGETADSFSREDVVGDLLSNFTNIAAEGPGPEQILRGGPAAAALAHSPSEIAARSKDETMEAIDGAVEEIYKTDSDIAGEIEDVIREDPRFDVTEINVDVNDGEVVLRGRTSDYLSKRLIGDLCETVHGVRSVTNLILPDKS